MLDANREITYSLQSKDGKFAWRDNSGRTISPIFNSFYEAKKWATVENIALVPSNIKTFIEAL